MIFGGFMREKINFDNGWLFYRGDIILEFPIQKAAAYNSAKTERALWGPAYQNFDFENFSGGKWEKINLPHDFVIEQLPDQKYNEALGFFKYENAWYIKKFTLNKEDKNKRITLLFDGVATHATIYLNGCLMKHNFSGYTTFEVDITDVVKYDQVNTLAVYVNTQNHEGWWYEGGGIYRHVWLIKTNLVSIDLWGVHAKPVLKENSLWEVKTATTVRNDFFNSKKRIFIEGVILDENGATISTSRSSGLIDIKDKRTFKYGFLVDNPKLWSPETPNQYIMRTNIYVGKNLVDSYDVKFGFRTVEIIPEKGLFINNKYYKIKGICGHADFGLTGKAVPDNIHRYKVQLMKEMGANGYRTTHYPQAAELMDALDENGFIVMNEVRWFESTDEGKAQLEMLMKRDRNRPSVFFWSIGNEEPHHETEEGRRIAQSLIAFAKKIDDSRYIMTAVTHSPEVATVYDNLEVVGINYNWEAYEAVHKRFPNKPILSSENCAAGTTRGYYLPLSPERAYMSAYDHDIDKLFRCREYTWNFISERDWIIGGYQWIAFEHRGEASWPRLCSQSGAIDLFMQKKDAYYQNISHWTDEPMVHLLPHWSFKGHENEVIKVFAYSNVSQLELFLNGKSLGVQNIARIAHGEWDVPYESGKLEVLAYKNGEVVAKDVRITSKDPYKLMLKLENDDISANGKDIAVVSCYAVDEDGNEVYDCDCLVEFTSNEFGTIYSTGSDVSDHVSLFSPVRKMREGRIGVAVKLGNKEGVLKVNAISDGLLPATLEINLSCK
jgi:beta-galactosidase